MSQSGVYSPVLRGRYVLDNLETGGERHMEVCSGEEESQIMAPSRSRQYQKDSEGAVAAGLLALAAIV